MIRALHGHCVDVLRRLPADSVSCCVTSPPYWGLRAYGTPPQVWGGDENCAHEWDSAPYQRRSNDGGKEGRKQGTNPGANGRDAFTLNDTCRRCNAWRGELGGEPTPDLYVAHLTEVFRAVRRVLHPTGSLFVNLGDSYAAGGNGPGAKDGRQVHAKARTAQNLPSKSAPPGLKPGDLCGVPWRAAFALQADGWLLRAAITCCKRSPMPESVAGSRWERCRLKVEAGGRPQNADARDLCKLVPVSEQPAATWAPCPGCPKCQPHGGYVLRMGGGRPTRATEMLFMLVKGSGYYFDQEGVRREPGEATVSRDKYPRGHPKGWHTDAVPINGGSGHDGIVRESAGGNPWDWMFWPGAEGSFPEAHFACVDEETECLTVHGWMRHDELRPGMLAAQYDTATDRLSWAPVEAVARYDVTDQPMVSARSRDIELLLTPNHRTLIRRRHPRTREWQAMTVIRADALKSSHGIPVSAEWEEGGEEPFSGEWAELLGWYLAEGFCGKSDWTVEIYQSRSANPEKVDRIRWLLEVVGAAYSEAAFTRPWRGNHRTCHTFQIRGYAAAFLRQWAPGKTFHPDTLRWSAATLKRLLAGLVAGDGCVREDGRESFVQKERHAANMAQAVAARLGYSTQITQRSEGTFAVYFTHKRLISLRGTAGRGAEIGTRFYTGVVWCPKLPAGTWVARKGGRAFITGNTYPPGIPAWCIKAGTSEKGVCAACGAPYVRVVEREKYGSWNSSDGTDRLQRGNWQSSGPMKSDFHGNWKPPQTLGWRPSCSHDAPCVPATVLDPFSGAGTTCMAADRLGRDGIGIDLNPEYTDMARRRLVADAGLFAEVIEHDDLPGPPGAPPPKHLRAAVARHVRECPACRQAAEPAAEPAAPLALPLEDDWPEIT